MEGRALVLLAALLPACSLIVDGDRFRNVGTRDGGSPRDGGVDRDGGSTPVDGGARDAGARDAGEDRDGGPRDAGPAGLTALDPDTLLEGIGAGAVVDVPLLIVGRGLPASPIVEVGASATVSVTLDTSSMLATSTHIAVLVRVAVAPDFDSGQTTVEITVRSSDGMFVHTLPLTIVGLPQLETTGDTTIDVSTLEPRYSTIDIGGGTVTITGNAATPAVLEATASVTIAGDVVLGGTGTAEAPGGCPGGTAQQQGACGPSGGLPGVAAFPIISKTTGGGGGGNGEAGGNAEKFDTDVGMGGAASPATWLAPLSDARGAGGGGGGGANGRVGGRGGGVLAVTSLGSLAVSGTIGAKGEPGVDANLTACSGMGASGGGSGGSILLRGRSLAGMSFTLDVNGGVGGLADNCADTGGGAGAFGQTRLDAPDILPSYTVLPTGAPDRRGPMFASDTAVLYESLPIVMTFIAENASFQWWLDGALQGTRPVSNGTGTLTINTAESGLRRVCVGVPDVPLTDTMGVNCIDIAVVY